MQKKILALFTIATLTIGVLSGCQASNTHPPLPKLQDPPLSIHHLK